MRTLHLHHVPDHVVEHLARIAEQERTTVEAVAVRMLLAVARRAENSALLGALPHVDVPTEDVVDAVAADRTERCR